jgi:hypothetical protein
MSSQVRFENKTFSSTMKKTIKPNVVVVKLDAVGLATAVLQHEQYFTFAFQIEWNSVPDHVVCAFPYILAITQESVEFRYAVNGSLLHSMCMPELRLITAKVRRKAPHKNEPLSFGNPFSIFKIRLTTEQIPALVLYYHNPSFCRGKFLTSNLGAKFCPPG